MARRGFIRRIADAIRKTVAPSPRPPQPPRPPEPPKRRTPTGPRDPYRAEWNRQHGKGSYQRQLALFHSAVDPIESDEGERLELWRSFIRNISRGEGQYRRQDSANLFWRDSGIDPADFDWAEWRVSMGYKGRGK